MSDRTLQLTRRRLLGGLVTVGGAGAAAGAGTAAFFSDAESSTGNTVQAGTLDLTVDSKNSPVTFLDATRIVPGDEGSGDVELHNAGSVDGELTVGLAAIRSFDSNGNQPGDLEDYLEVRGIVEWMSGTPVTEIFGWQTVADLRGTTLNHTPVSIPSGGSRRFVLEWRLPQSTKNKAKGDSVEIDFDFTLNQSGP